MPLLLVRGFEWGYPGDLASECVYCLYNLLDCHGLTPDVLGDLVDEGTFRANFLVIRTSDGIKQRARKLHRDRFDGDGRA